MSVANNSPVVNLVAIAVTAHLSGLVQDSNGNPIRGVQVYADATLNGALHQAQADTDASGHYTLNVANGSWTAHLNCNSMNVVAAFKSGRPAFERRRVCGFGPAEALRVEDNPRSAPRRHSIGS